MDKPIVNRVEKSPLVTLDLEELFPKEKRVALDISPWLFEELVIREKEFRAHLKEHNWSAYKDCYVALHCKADAIIPGWAYMLIGTYLTPYAKLTHVGTLEDLEGAIGTEVIRSLDINLYQGVPVIIKGCTNLPIPDHVYVALTQKIQGVAKSVMYGEACSSVPLYKKR